MSDRRVAVWLGVALFVSLAANVFVGGLILGKRVADRGEVRGGGVGIERLLQGLSDPDRRTMREVFIMRRPAIADKVQALRAARGEAAGLLRSEPFDASAFAAALAAIRDRTLALQTAIHAVVVEAAPHLTPEGRAKLSEMRWRRP